MSDIKEMVELLRGQYGTSDPFSLCEAMRIGVLYCDLPAEIKGFYLKIDSSQVVFINQDLDEADARVTCGHELGHAMLHSDYNAVYMRTQTLMNCRRYEREADLFCACLLLEEEPEGQGDAEAITMEDIAKRAGLPERLVRLRYRNLQ